MIAQFQPCRLSGSVDAPPSKSMAHRYLIGAALSGKTCTMSGFDYSEDILASIDCLRALGAEVMIEGDCVTVDPEGFMRAEKPVLLCRESGSTLRFFIPLALCLGQEVILRGSQRLLQRPLDIYEEIYWENGFAFEKTDEEIRLCGRLQGGQYTVRGDISSQFITGLIFALLHLGEDSVIDIIPPFESRSYVDLTLSALRSFGADVAFSQEYRIEIKKSKMYAYHGRIEGDYSNAAFLDAFNHIGSQVRVGNLKADSLQGDRVYQS